MAENEAPVPSEGEHPSTVDTEGMPEGGIVRREFLSGSGMAMVGGLVASYGTLVVFAGRYLYPSGPQPKAWVYLTDLKSMKKGDSLEWESPTGEKIVVARQEEVGEVDDFIALSSVCPHLGCQVHWEAHNDRFFCPCHNGVFTPEGVAIEGPPAQAGQRLAEYPLKIEQGLLFIEVPTETLTMPQEV
jgi:Rieske Fe-S protein